MSIDLTHLRKVVEAATPGPWSGDTAGHGEPWEVFAHDGSDYELFVADCGTGMSNAAYIATFDPPTVRALLDRIERAEAALETFAILANEETDYLPDEHVISLTYDDSDIDHDLGGPNTLLGERFMRAFRAARQALTQEADRG